MGTQYSLQVRNNSSNKGYICVYQTLDNAPWNLMPLAWLSQPSFPSTIVQFEWEENYGFIYGETGELRPGVRVVTRGIMDADPFTQGGINEVALTYHQGYSFKEPRQNSRAAGRLVIIGDSTIPVRQAAVGFAMAGRGTHVSQAQPNWTTVFTPKQHTYWIAFGDYPEGTVLDTEALSITPQKLDFTGVNRLAYTLDANNLWVRGIQ